VQVTEKSEIIYIYMSMFPLLFKLWTITIIDETSVVVNLIKLKHPYSSSPLSSLPSGAEHTLKALYH
jgi:hypothetical protein